MSRAIKGGATVRGSQAVTGIMVWGLAWKTVFLLFPEQLV